MQPHLQDVLHLDGEAGSRLAHYRMLLVKQHNYAMIVSFFLSYTYVRTEHTCLPRDSIDTGLTGNRVMLFCGPVT
jgi:hypothetical protein